MGVSVDEPEDKTAIYQEPYNMNMYTGVPPPGTRKTIEPAGMGRRVTDGGISPEYTDVPDLVAAQAQDYAVPHIVDTKQSNIRSLPSLHNFFPKPPPVPPPPEKYYATTDVCKGGDKIPPHHISSPVERRKTPTINPATVYSMLSPRILSDFNTDSEFPVTETEDEGCDDDSCFVTITNDQLCVIEQLGYGQFGEIKLCEMLDNCPVIKYSSCRLVAVKSLRPGASETTRDNFRQEARILTKIKDNNIVRVLGGCLHQEPLYVVVEYMELGDLNQLLQEHIADTTSPLPLNAKTLSYGCLIYMATQIASGMKYLESFNFVHRDLATRNCLVGKNYSVKVSDLGMSRSLYSGDYYQLDGCAVLPIRWMAWESVLLGKFTTKSDVWSFAVTLWEILTFAREQPFEDLTDEKVLENVNYFYQDSEQQLLLAQPKNCPKEIFDLMKECWQRNESERPNFREIHLFLQRKNLGYKI